ncbi:MAG: S-layer homology domain-containing protein [Solirubrobacterales bacterium]
MMRAAAAVLLTAVMLLGMPVNPMLAASSDGKAVNPAPAAFSDVKADHPSAPYYRYVTARGMMKGYPDGSFRPDTSMTRAEMAAMLVHAKGLKPYTPRKAAFKDVNTKHWAFGQIEAASRAGLLKGYTNGTFRPNQPVTRAETAALLLKLTGQTSPALTLPASVRDVKPDSWAKKSIATVLDAGIMKTITPGSFAPDRPATRGQIARGMAAMLTMAPEFYRVDLPTVVVPVKGKVTVTEKGKTEQIITADASCLPGAVIKTGVNTEAQVKFPDGTNFLIKDNTELIIEAARGQSIIKQDGTPGTVVDFVDVRLPQGKLFGALAASYLFGHTEETAPPASASAVTGKTSDGAARLFAQAPAETGKNQWYKEASAKRVRVKVNMPWGIAGIRGCFWSNAVTANGQSTSVAEGGSGDVSVSSGGSTVDVGTGESTTTAGSGAPPSAPAPLNPSQQADFAQQQSWVQETLTQIAQNVPAPAPAAAEGDEGDKGKQGEQDKSDKPDKPAQALKETLDKVLNQVEQSSGQGHSAPDSDKSTNGKTLGLWSDSGDGGGEPLVVTLAAVSSKTVRPGETLSVPVTVSPADATLTVSSSQPGIVAWSLSGTTLTLSGNSSGSATITVVASKTSYTSATITFTAVCQAPVEIKSLAAGYSHSLLVNDDGTVWAMGYGREGQLGNGRPGDVGFADSTVPVKVYGLTSVTAAAAGGEFSLALTTGGLVYAWGLNDYGQLGLNIGWLPPVNFNVEAPPPPQPARIPLAVPVFSEAYPELLTNISAIAAGYYFAMALDNNGYVWTWGGDEYFALGHESQVLNGMPLEGDPPTGSLLPKRVVGSDGSGYLSNIIAISAGRNFALALDGSGQVWAWGAGGSGQTGDPALGDSGQPRQITGITGTVTQIAAGENNAFALTSDGSVWMWGNSQSLPGVAGHPETPQKLAFSGMIKFISAGKATPGMDEMTKDFVVAVDSAKTVWALGNNEVGQLGDGSGCPSATPVQVANVTGAAGALSEILEISAGDKYALAKDASGRIIGWGDNNSGLIGDGTLGQGDTYCWLGPVYTALSLSEEMIVNNTVSPNTITVVSRTPLNPATASLPGSWTIECPVPERTVFSIDSVTLSQDNRTVVFKLTAPNPVDCTSYIENAQMPFITISGMPPCDAAGAPSPDGGPGTEMSYLGTRIRDMDAPTLTPLGDGATAFSLDPGETATLTFSEPLDNACASDIVVEIAAKSSNPSGYTATWNATKSALTLACPAEGSTVNWGAAARTLANLAGVGTVFPVTLIRHPVNPSMVAEYPSYCIVDAGQATITVQLNSPGVVYYAVVPRPEGEIVSPAPAAIAAGNVDGKICSGYIAVPEGFTEYGVVIDNVPYSEPDWQQYVVFTTVYDGYKYSPVIATEFPLA